MFDFLKDKVFVPTTCRLEACSLCQLNCRTCYMRLKNYGAIGKGYLTAKNFEKFLTLNPQIKKIELSNNGEIFLNPELVDIMRIAYEKGIMLYAYNGVNLNNVKDEVIDALVKYNFDGMVVSIDGASNETYSKYRVNGNFDEVIENIKKINEAKKKYKKTCPYLRWQYVILPFNSNIEEIRKAKEMAKSLDMEIYFKKDWWLYIPQNSAEIYNETGLSYENEAIASNCTSRWLPCAEVFFNPQVNWDGRFLGCCTLADDIYDLDAFSMSLEEILNTKEIQQIKELIRGKLYRKEEAKNLKCYKCWFYGELCKSGEFVTKKELKAQEETFKKNAG